MINKTNNIVTYCILTYNQENFIGSSIKSVLKQVYSPLEIIISDDNSTDNTFSIIKEIVNDYMGPHKISLYRNESNLGIGAHFAKVMSLANGEYIIFLGGDDIAKPMHVKTAVEIMRKFPEISMVDFNADIINEKGEKTGENKLNFEMKKYVLKDYLDLKIIQSFAPGRIFKRELIDDFEPISKNCPTEDSILVLRSLMTTGFIRLNINLLSYRIHSNNISSSLGLSKISNQAITSQNLRDITYLFNLGKLNKYVFKQLLDRVILELKIRDLDYSITRFMGMKLLKKIHKHYLKFFYKKNSIDLK